MLRQRIVGVALLALVALVAVLVAATLSAAQMPAGQVPAPRGRLLVTVVDQSGAVIPNASVAVTAQEETGVANPIAPASTSNTGIAVIDRLADRRYTIQVEFPGFDTAVVRDVRVRSGDTRRRVTLQIKKLHEAVIVSRDRQTSSLDPRGSAFSSVLTREQIEALPDDPDEMEAVLKAMSPPGSVIRVDGFTGGRLPPKSQIRSIRLPRMDMFAAQNHGGITGMMHIDIMTSPGNGPLRGNMDFNFRRGAECPQRLHPREADEQLRQFGYGLFGRRPSFSLTAALPCRLPICSPCCLTARP